MRSFQRQNFSPAEIAFFIEFNQMSNQEVKKAKKIVVFAEVFFQKKKQISHADYLMMTKKRLKNIPLYFKEGMKKNAIF